MWLVFAALAILSLQCSLLLYFHIIAHSTANHAPCDSQGIFLSHLWRISLDPGLGLQVPELSESEAELTTCASLFQKPKGRPTFAELLRVLSEIAETW